MQDPTAVVLSWGGDVTLARRQHVLLGATGEAAPDLPAFRSADLRLVNLECVISTLGEQGADKGEGGPYYFRARPEMTAVLGRMGVDLVATANNHAGDYGADALLDQARWLERAGIAQAGSGRDRESAFESRFIQRKGLNIAVFALDATQPEFAAKASTPGTAYLPITQPSLWQEEMQPRIRRARELADVVVVAVHWGPNLKTTPGPRQIEAGHALIRAGADAVLGSSAHVLQGVEVFEGRPIIHDAGNLLCDFVEAGGEGAVFRLQLGKSGVVGVEVVPLTLAPGRASEADGDAAEAILARFNALCTALGTTTGQIRGGRLHIPLAPRPRQGGDPLLQSVRARYEVPSVPPAAQVAPVKLGPLTLLGAQIGPETMTERQMLWVDTWWTAPDLVEEPLQIALHGIPQTPGKMPIWGAGMAHEPCDWQLPATDWEPGRIYHERFGLRPPPRAKLEDGTLDLEISVLDGPRRLARCRPGRQVSLAFGAASPPSVGRAAQVYATPLSAAPTRANGWTADELAQVTGGRWITAPPPHWHARSTVAGVTHVPMVPGPTLFAAHNQSDRNRHENFTHPPKRSWDSHQVVAQHARNLAGAIVRHRPEGVPDDFALLQVDDPLAALMKIGEAARMRMRGQVICVTGSSGKTTTVSMLNSVLSPLINSQATYDNYNTRVGMLVNLASVQQDTDAMVLETALSAINSAGFAHIKRVAPDMAVITNIATAHMGEGETTADIARKKSNIFEGMVPGKTAILWRETEHFDYIADRARQCGLQVRTFGSGPLADFRLLDHDASQSAVEVMTPSGPLRYRIGAPGLHMALNSLACLAVADGLSLDLARLAKGFADFGSLPGRGQRHEIAVPGGAIWLQDDAYNANPLSMRAALQGFGATHSGASARTLILGDMLELGPQSATLHAELVPHILAVHPSQVVLVGAQMPQLADQLRAKGVPTETAQTAQVAARLLPNYKVPGTAILIKASNGVGLWQLVSELLDR